MKNNKIELSTEAEKPILEYFKSEEALIRWIVERFKLENIAWMQDDNYILNRARRLGIIK